jgi:hypothetical protein
MRKNAKNRDLEQRGGDLGGREEENAGAACKLTAGEK